MVARIKELQHQNRMSQKWIARLTQKIEELTAKNGVNSDDDESDDLNTIMTEEEKECARAVP